jgi:hypothetical protein
MKFDKNVLKKFSYEFQSIIYNTSNARCYYSLDPRLSSI